MKLEINGKEHSLDNNQTVTSMLEHLELEPNRVVVEVNREIVPRKKFSDHLLSDGDSIEILHFVGGGLM